MIKFGSELRLYTTTLNTEDQFLLEVEQIACNKNTRTSTFEIRGYILDYTMNVDSEALSYEVEVYMGTKSATSYTRGETVFQYQKDKAINWISREGMNIGQPLYEHSRCHFFTHQFTVKHPHTTYSTEAKFVVLLDVQAHRHDALANYDYRFNSTYGYGDNGSYTHTPQWLNVRANLLEEDESDNWYLKPEFPFTYYDEPINILYKHRDLEREDMFGVFKYQYSNTKIEIKRIRYDEYITVQGMHSFEWTPNSNIASSFFATGEYVKDITLVLEIYQTSKSYPNGILYQTYQTPLKVFQSASVERPGGVMSISGSATFEKYNPKTEGNRYARFIDDVLITLTANCYHGDATPYAGFIENGGFTYMIDFANGETSKVIMDIPDDYFKFTVIDTLGRRGETFDYLPGTFYEYFYPTARVSETVLSGNTGTLTFTVEGEMYLGVYDTSGLKNNLRYASYGVYDSEDLYTPIVWNSVWGYEEEINPTYGDGTYSFTIEVPNLNYMRSYVVVVSVSDKFNTVTTEKARARLDPMFDWGPDDFKFNVPVFIRPNGVEDEAHEIRITTGGNIELAGDIIINGKSLVEILTNAGLLT